MNTLAHTSAHLPTLALKCDGGILVISTDYMDPYEGDEEVTRTDIRVPSLTKEERADNWCDGLTFFAIILAVGGFIGMCAQDMADKSAARQERVRLDQNCALTYR